MTNDEFYGLYNQLTIKLKELTIKRNMHEGMTQLLEDEYNLFIVILKNANSSIISDAEANTEKFKDIHGVLLKKLFPEQNKLRNTITSMRALGIEDDTYNSKCLYDISQLEVHLDYLGRAEQLIKDGQKDAAYIIMGSTLNLYLRDFSDLVNIELKYVDSRGILMNKSSEVLYNDLVKNNCFFPEDENMIHDLILVLDDAEQWKDGAYTEEEILTMVEVIKEFLETEIKMDISE